MIPASDASFFSTVASIAATLIGLSFFVLIFFLTELIKRYKGLALPVHHEMLRSRLQDIGEEQRKLPEHITDFGLFDSDPLVFFSAFSIAVSWNLYFVSLVVSLTAVSSTFANAWVLAIELIAFWFIFRFSLKTRNAKRDELAPYRTREEHFLGVFEWIFKGLWLMGMALIFIAALAMDYGTHYVYLNRLAFWSTCGIDNMTMVLSILKIISLGTLCFGLFVTNKDLFVFFKSKTSDQMRRLWLVEFVQGYPELKKKVEASIAAQGEPAATEFKTLWNEGCPTVKYVRDGFSPSQGKPDVRWEYLLTGKHSVASWMFDVSGISLWVSDLENSLIQNRSAEAP